MQHFGVCKKRAFGIPMPLPVLLNDKYRQAVRIMKITAYILLVCTLHVSAGGFSQSITLSEKEAPLTKVFKAIEKQTDYIFFYNVEWVKKTDKVNVEVKNLPLQQVLDLLFKNQLITYSITGKMITVFPKKNDVVKANDNVSPSMLLDLHGKVVDENGKPIPGVTVIIKGTTRRTITNENGEFVFNGVEGNAVLSFSSVNMEAFEINVAGKSEVLAKLKTKTSQLDEVQIIAYGQTTRRFQTGNVSTIKAVDIEQQPISNPLLALQGRVPGLTITQESGMTGGPVTIRVQGQNSIFNGNDPLIVVDGVPYPSSVLRTGLENVLGTNGMPSQPSPLNFINPLDIESIDILKDADATAIYGSRAANGAILITTKKGKAGNTKIDINVQNGWGKVANKVDMLNSRQYLDMRYEGFKNDGITNIPSNQYDLKLWDTSRFTDWQKTLIGGVAQFRNINATVSGGTINTQYLLSATYQRQTTVFPGDFSDQRGALHLSINNVSTNQRFRLQFTSNYMYDDNHLPGNDLTSKAIKLEPVAPTIYDDNGDLNWSPNSLGNSTWENPLVDIYYRTYSNKTNNLVSNIQLSYMLVHGLELKSSFGFNKLQTTDFNATKLFATKPEYRNVTPSPRQSAYGFRDVNSWIIEPQLNYKTAIGKGKFEGLVGASVQQNSNTVTNIFGSGYTSDEDLKNTAAAVSLTSNVYYSKYKYNALFGRLNYNWQNKYILNLSARRDGSSRFGDKNKFHNFGSVGAAWIFSEEKLIEKQLHILSFGKLRASYGTTGNDQIGDYSFMDLYNVVFTSLPYQNSTGLAPSGLANHYLEWESTHKLQFGLDLGFYSDRILLGINYARNRSSNQLLNYSLPTVTGFFDVTDNFPATVQNTSWEFSLSTVNVKTKNTSWTLGFNLTIPRNKLVEFPNLENSSYYTTLIVGQPIGIRRVYHFVGVDPAKGSYLVADSTGKPTSSPNSKTDRTVIINQKPKFFGGFQSTFQYKSIQIDFLFQFVKQTGNAPFALNNGTALNPGVFQSGSSNQPVSVLDRWQKPGDVTSIQRYSSSLFSLYPPLSNAKSSDVNFSDASFIRLKNLSISYQLKGEWLKKLHLQNLKLYIRGQNLFTITNYKGLDPENQSIDVLPPLRIITTGLQINF